MIEYSYDDLKSIEYLEVDSEQMMVNGITIFDIDRIHFHEFDHEFIQMRLLSGQKEVAGTDIQPNEKLVVDDEHHYMIIPSDGMGD